MAIEAVNDSRGRVVPWRILGWGSAAFLLLLPLVAMQFTSEVNWTAFDFVFAGVMFAIVGGTLELAAWKSGKWAYRAAVGIAVAAGLLHVWLTGAVGIIGNEANPGNLLYLAVVVIAICGSIVALGRPSGMAWAMAATALAEIATPLLAYAFVADPAGDVLQPEVFFMAFVFTSMWLVSAGLFRATARDRL